MEKPNPLNYVLIVAIVALCLWSLYPPDQKLRQGLDLAGGSILVYEVDVPPDQPSRRTIEQVIDVLRERVDPSGVRNLVWRPQAGNRLEIQMPMASQNTIKARQNFYQELEQLFEGSNIVDAQSLDDTLPLPPEQRRERFEVMAQGNQELRQALNRAAEAYQALQKAKAPYEQAQKAKQRLREALEQALQQREQGPEQDQEPHSAQTQPDPEAEADLEAEADQEAEAAATQPEEEQESLEQRIERLRAELRAAQAQSDRATPELYQAQQRYERARQDVLRFSLDRGRFERLLKLPNDTDDAQRERFVQWLEQNEDLQPLLELAEENDRDAQGEAGAEAQADLPEVTPLQRALAEYITRYPQFKSKIIEVYRAFERYEALRGPLDDPEDLEELIRGSGVLGFYIAPTPGEVTNLQEHRERLMEQQGADRVTTDEPFIWLAIDDPSKFAGDRRDRELLKEQGVAALFATKPSYTVEVLDGDRAFMLLHNTPTKRITQAEGNWQLSEAYQTIDQSGLPAVGFQLNARGATLMGQLTSRNTDKPMAIVLDGKVISAPNIQGRIAGQGQITGGRGGFSQSELDYLIRTLNAGSLSARISEEPISQKTIGPQFGQDNLRAGYNAAVWALVLVIVFMIAYYFFWGAMATIALLMNMVLILGVMAAIQATFTLPGIAGIVLTIGMAVDANVLIFERIREELRRRKNDLAVAVREGYDKALSTILDANITTLITCLVLGYTATAEVRGFAVTLGIGILATLFSTLYAVRVLIEAYLAYSEPRELPMLPQRWAAIRKALSPNIDWVGMRRWYVGISAVLMVAGILAIYSRGSELLDIEFRSGTQVGFELAEGKTLSLSEARQRLEQADERTEVEELTEAQLVTVGQEVDGEYTAFNISVLNENAEAVSNAVKALYEDVLDTEQPIRFDGADQDRHLTAPVYPILDAELGRNIDRPRVDQSVRRYRGGVAIVLEDLQPVATVQELTERIERMRRQPAFEQLPYRRFEVIGLDPAEASAGPGSPQRYRSAVVVSAEEGVNYVKSPDAFQSPLGMAAEEWNLVNAALTRGTTLSSVANFSSSVSRTMQYSAMAAMFLSLLAVVGYVALRFGSVRYGLAAIAALVHDVTIALGLVAISVVIAESTVGQLLLIDPFRIDLAMVAAMLTIVGYSLNDTIVVFDRVRENRGKLPQPTPQVINDSINQTISRTVLTSTTTLLAVLTLFILGGAGVHGFAFAMLVGVVIGTYSSVAVASPLLLSFGAARRTQAADKPTQSSVPAEV